MIKRLPISPEERLFFKSIERTAVVVLIMFRIFPVALNAETLAYEMKWDPRTAGKYLDELASDHLTLLMKGQGYVLTSQARTLVAQFFGAIVSIPFEAQALAPESQVQAQQVLESGVAQIERNDLGEAESYTHSVCALEEVEESSLILRIKDSTSPIKSAQNVLTTNALTTKNILEHSSILFGEPGVVTARLELDLIPPHYALGWMAQAYDQRRRDEYPHGLSAPAGLVYSRLRDIEKPKPRASYYAEPEKYLPDDYLEALGLVDYSCTACGEKFTKSADLAKHESLMFICEHGCSLHFHTLEQVEIHYTAEHARKAVDVGIRPLDADHKASIAWEAVKDQLRLEMNRASFDNWVSRTQAVHYDGKVLTVGACNLFSRDWLESRLAPTAEQALAGIMEHHVSVRFVVADVFEEQDDEL